MSIPSTGETACTCDHPVACNHGCHGRHCDPTEHVCSLEFLPDDGGLTPWGCAECTPGARLAHLVGCPAPTAAAPGSTFAGSTQITML
ncbi:MAG: hypothetical protein ABIZ72_03080 [Candidatus Limnocylindrales bacterium]